MKTVSKNLLVAVVFMLGTLFSYAANMDGSLKNSKVVRVVFENVTKNHSLIIKDSEGIILHKENVLKNGELVKLFDFSSLKDGKYKIEVDKDYEILVRNFEVKNKALTFTKDAETIIFKPVVKNKEDKILISRINFDRTAMDVTIYYNGSPIVEETITSKENIINKVYKVNGLEKGDYKVVVSNNAKSYIQDFSL